MHSTRAIFYGRVTMIVFPYKSKVKPVQYPRPEDFPLSRFDFNPWLLLTPLFVINKFRPSSKDSMDGFLRIPTVQRWSWFQAWNDSQRSNVIMIIVRLFCNGSILILTWTLQTSAWSSQMTYLPFLMTPQSPAPKLSSLCVTHLPTLAHLDRYGSAEDLVTVANLSPQSQTGNF
jgi:hypothetical protein